MTVDPEALVAGNHVQLNGGYDQEPKWLNGRDAVEGTVLKFIQGQNDVPAAVVRLNAPIEVEGEEGEILVLGLRYVGQTLKSRGTVHLELCDFVPSAVKWKDRRKGKWIESHATYQRLSR